MRRGLLDSPELKIGRIELGKSKLHTMHYSSKMRNVILESSKKEDEKLIIVK